MDHQSNLLILRPPAASSLPGKPHSSAAKSPDSNLSTRSILLVLLPLSSSWSLAFGTIQVTYCERPSACAPGPTGQGLFGYRDADSPNETEEIGSCGHLDECELRKSKGGRLLSVAPSPQDLVSNGETASSPKEPLPGTRLQ
ncbi:hypothetical protein TWF103_006661 [Orbilia oligospora]|nr:hypothetical protein TWF103_006661 [Orbilia oligospora]